MKYKDLINALNAADKRPCSAMECPGSGECPDVGCLFREAADAIEELSKDRVCRIVEHDGVTELSVVPRWIPVTERLPEDDCNCIVFSDGYVKEAHFYFGKFYDPIEDYMRYKATHWMPLPEPPKEETE